MDSKRIHTKRWMTSLGTAAVLLMGAHVATAQAADPVASTLPKIGQEASAVAKDPNLAHLLVDLMGPTAWTTARGYAVRGIESPVVRHQKYLVAFACKPHDCDTDKTVWVFGPDKELWAALVSNGHSVIYPKGHMPSAEVQSLLDGNGT